MAKTKSFVEKQDKQLYQMRLYNESFLYLYEKELADKRQNELEQFSKEHPDEDQELHKMVAEAQDREKIYQESLKLEKKVQKKEKKFENKRTVNSRRIWEIDFLRGLVIIGMLIDHFFYDFIGLFTNSNFNNLPAFYLDIGSFASLYWVHPVRVTFRFIGIFLLFFLSGISAHFSKSSIKRSLVVMGAGLLMSAAFIGVVQFTGNKNDLVLMGAIMAIGVCMFIYSLFKMAFHRFDKVYKWIVLIIALAILITWGFVSYNVAINRDNFWFYYNGYARSIEVVPYKNLWPNIGYVLFGTKYFGSDWMGLFPALGYTFLGAFVGETLYKDRKSIFGKYNEKLNRSTLAVVIPGRYSLWFYLLHQIIYIIIIGALALIMGAQIRF